MSSFRTYASHVHLNQPDDMGENIKQVKIRLHMNDIQYVQVLGTFHSSKYNMYSVFIDDGFVLIK